VPPYLMLYPNVAGAYAGLLRVVSVPKVCTREELLADDKQLRPLRDVVGRRIDVDRLFAPTGQLDRILTVCGGHLREVLKMVWRVVAIAADEKHALPVGDGLIERVVTETARQFGVFTREDAALLRLIHAGRTEVFEPPADRVHRMSQLMDAHVVLAHLNGEQWFEVHPLARRALKLDPHP
jgi:hypothetical protein